MRKLLACTVYVMHAIGCKVSNELQVSLQLQGTLRNTRWAYLFHSSCTSNFRKDESHALHISIVRQLVPGFPASYILVIELFQLFLYARDIMSSSTENVWCMCPCVIFLKFPIANSTLSYTQHNSGSKRNVSACKHLYLRALFSPSVTASFRAFSIDSAFDLIPSETPYPTSSWYVPSFSCTRTKVLTPTQYFSPTWSMKSV